MLASLAGRIYDDAPQQNANPLGSQARMRLKAAVEFLKPVAIGAAALGGITFARILIAILAGHRAKDPNEATDAVGLAALGSGAAGLMYSLLGRPLRRYGAVGNYAAGIVTVFPYFVFLILLLGKMDPSEKMPIDDPWTWGLLGFMSILAGVFLGREFHEKDNLFKDS